MRVFITCHAGEDTGIPKTCSKLYHLGCDKHFKERDYGLSLAGVSVVLMCSDPYWNFNRRIRMDWKDKTLRMDIMLDYNQMKSARTEERQREVAQRLYDEVHEVLEKYRKKLKDFDMDRFVKDWQSWMGLIT